MSKLEVDAIEPQSGTTLTLGASGDSVNIASGATITDFTSTGIDDNATSTAITIGSNQNIGIGTTNSTLARLYVTNDTGDVDDNGLYVYSNLGQTVPLVRIIQDGAGSTGEALYVRNDGSGNALTVDDGSLGNTVFVIDSDSDGNVLVGKTSTSVTVDGVQLRGVGQINITRGGDVCLMLNRQTTDGTLQEFRHANVTEGTISVSGATVAYNGFTGTHWSRFTDNSTPTILKGTVLESLDEMCDWYNLHFETTTTKQDSDGNDVTNTENHVVPHVLQDGQSDGDVITYNHEGTDVQATIVKEADVKHVKSKVSDTVDAKNVYGVFSAYDEDGEGYNDFYVASVGSFVVRIKQGETVAKGDLLQSNGDGTAKVQTDDAIRASTFAKVLSTTVIETYEDGSFLVPCSLMC